MEIKKNGEYYFIKNVYFNELRDNVKPVYVLDSNVVIDIGRLYYKINTIKDPQKYNTKQLIIQLKKDNAKVNYRYALTELSADYLNGGVSDKKYKKLKFGIDELLKKSEKQLDKYCTYGKNDNCRVDSNQSEFGQVSKVIEKTLILLFRSYIPIANLFLLFQNLNKDNRMEIFKKYINFLDVDFKVIGLYEFVIGVFYLLNSEEEFNNIQELIKVQNKIEIIKKIWNVSWDITFLRFINDNSCLLLSNEDALIKGNCILVTKDRALAETAELLNIAASRIGEKRIPSISIDENKIKSKYLEEYKEIYNDIINSEKFDERKEFLENMRLKEEVEHYIKLTDDITNKLRN